MNVRASLETLAHGISEKIARRFIEPNVDVLVREGSTKNEEGEMLIHIAYRPKTSIGKFLNPKPYDISVKWGSNDKHDCTTVQVSIREYRFVVPFEGTEAEGERDRYNNTMIIYHPPIEMKMPKISETDWSAFDVALDDALEKHGLYLPHNERMKISKAYASLKAGTEKTGYDAKTP